MAYSFSGRVRYSEIGENGLLTLPGILNYFQDCSTFHSEAAGLGVKVLKEKNKFWVLSAGRFSGGTSGLSIGHISPEAAAGGNIGKIVDGDIIEIDIPNRSINVKLSDEELAARPMTPVTRDRKVPKSLKAYASMVSSADKGGVRIID